LLYKGNENAESDKFNRAPAILFDRYQRTLGVFVTTSDQENPEGEYLLSTSSIPNQRWTHITVLRLNQKLRLYINGILDTAINT